MNIFDIVGPVMVGPSSSHTAGAVKIGYVARKIMSQPIVDATINMYGSFLATGGGHGTRYALVAGLLGMMPDDERIPDSFRYADEAGMKYRFGEADLKEAHPNSVQLILRGRDGHTLEVVGESIGGSLINIARIDGLSANFSGEYPTLIVYNEDQPGHVAEVTRMLAERSINIATLKLYRGGRGKRAVMVIECDQEIPKESIEWLEKRAGIDKVTYYSLL
ncbi:MAG: L-serine ammonia-lyase, iron-sulfur-dependent subunit beta [Agathobacter sp.]|nr:L-serine ammonia-lyase, iron-sulfur-dependent subunit beta [Agathobacter sp.]